MMNRLFPAGSMRAAQVAIAFLALVATDPYAAAAAGLADASRFPSKPVRLIVPFAPGGGTDFVARMIGQKLTESMGQPVIIDNRGGGSAMIGTELVAKAPPDGHTLGIITAEQTIVPHIVKTVPFRITRDFTPITQTTRQAYVLVVHPSVAANSVKELIGVIKASGGRFNFGTAQHSVGHLAGELLKVRTGVQMTHIPYKGTGPALTDLLGGQISFMFSTFPPAVPHIKAGRLRALAVSAAARSKLLPELPTVAESGIPGFEATGWNGFLLPAKAPRSVLMKFHQEIVRALALPDVQERYARAGTEPVGGTPEQFAALIAEELGKWGKVVKEANLKLDE